MPKNVVNNAAYLLLNVPWGSMTKRLSNLDPTCLVVFSGNIREKKLKNGKSSFALEISDTILGVRHKRHVGTYYAKQDAVNAQKRYTKWRELWKTQM